MTSLKSIPIIILVVSLILVGVSFSYGAKKELLQWTGYPELLPYYEKVARDYEKEHPEVKIEVAAFELREYERKMAASIPAGTAADVMESSRYAMQQYVEAGYIHNNPPEIDKFFRSKSFLPLQVEHMTYKGETYGLPLFTGVVVNFWNKSMFKEAGLPGPPKTWDELIEHSRKLVRYDEKGELTRSGHSLRLSGAGSGVAEKFWFVLYQAGGDVVVKTPTGKYRNGYNNQAGRDALKFYIDAVWKYHFDDHKIKHDAEAFALERTAMFFREGWVIGYVKKHNPKMDFDAAHMPKWRRWGTLMEWKSMFVAKSCKYPEVAWELIMQMEKPEYLQFMLDKIGWLPCRRDVDFSEVIKKTPQYQTFLTFPKGYEIYAYYSIRVADELYTKLAERLVKAYLDKGLVDNPEGIAKVIAEAAKETDDILKDAGLYGEK